MVKSGEKERIYEYQIHTIERTVLLKYYLKILQDIDLTIKYIRERLRINIGRCLQLINVNLDTWKYKCFDL